jgi:hypothetical protein
VKKKNGRILGKKSTMEPHMSHSNVLIDAIIKDASGAYSDWKIGITSSGRMNTEGMAAIYYTGYDSDEILEAFQYFTQRGMKGLHRIGAYAENIYIFNVNGVKVPGPVPKYDEDGRTLYSNSSQIFEIA